MRKGSDSRARPEEPATARSGSLPARRDAPRTSSRITRVMLALAVCSIAALALLVPTAPLLGLLLIAAVLGGAVAVLVRHPRHDTDEHASLDDLETAGYVVLRDRAAPGFAGTVRRLVIGPGGVFLVEMVDVGGRVRIRGDAVVVGGRSLALGSRLQGQMRAVSSALAPQLTGAGAHVTPLICMRRAELPVFHRSVAGIPLSREAGVVRRIAAAPSILDAATVAWIADLARSTMPPAGREGPDVETGEGPPRRSRRGPVGRTRVAGADGATDPLTEIPSPA